MDKYMILKGLFNNKKRIVFFTGAGISVPSGIPDFRSQSGIYSTNAHAEEYLSHHFFESHPDAFYDFYKNHMCYPNALPNSAHKWIASLGNCLSVITQNVDGLHQAAGSQRVWELHGSIYRNFCLKCHKAFDLNYVLKSEGVPHCDQCGGIIKPDVVLYEENLDEDIIVNAIKDIAVADLLIVIGTSLNVYPAASFIRYFRGDKLVLINKSTTPFDDYADIVIHEDITKTVEKLTSLPL